MITYASFIAKQGVLIENGGGWVCAGFGSPCSQVVLGSNYGPIVGTATFDAAASNIHLEADIDLADNEFVGATSMSYTIKWRAMASSQGGNPSKVNSWTWVGSLDNFSDFIPYTTEGTSVTHNGGFGTRPPSIKLYIHAGIEDFGGANVTITYPEISFEIYDVVYGAMSATADPASSAGSSMSSLSNTSSTSALVTSRSTFLSSFPTTISGHATIIQTIASQSLRASESRLHLPWPSSSPDSTSGTASELAKVITGLIIGVGTALLATAFWYQWWRRRRVTSSGRVPRRNGQSEIDTNSRMANQEPWVPRPYRKRPHSPTTENEISIPVEDERAELWVPLPYCKRLYSPITEIVRVPPVEDQRAEPVERQEAILPSGPGSEIVSSYRLNFPPPAYSQITPRLASRSSAAIENA